MKIKMSTRTTLCKNYGDDTLKGGITRCHLLFTLLLDVDYSLRGRHLSLHSLTTNFNVLFILLLIFLRVLSLSLSLVSILSVVVAAILVLIVSHSLPILLFQRIDNNLS